MRVTQGPNGPIVEPQKPSYERLELTNLQVQRQLMVTSFELLKRQIPEIDQAITDKEAECLALEQPPSPSTATP